MRRICALAVLAVCTLFCFACNKMQTAAPVTLDFSCRFSAQYDDLKATGEMVRTADKVLTITFDTPDTLSDVSLIWDGEEVRMRVFGIETALPQAYLPQGALGTVLGGALDDALDRVGSETFSNGGAVLSGTVGEHAYTLHFDGQNGIPFQLEVPSLPLSIVFSDFIAN